MTWGFDSISSVKFNPIETFLLGSCASDRNIVLYDMRQATPLKKVILDMRTNTICWNPMEAFIFTAANEDYNLYTFDMRVLDTPVMVHMDHVSAVLDVDYSPLGKSLCLLVLINLLESFLWTKVGAEKSITQRECSMLSV